MMTTLVTGGFGYLGREVVTQLRARGTRVISYNRDYSEGGTDDLIHVQGELYDLPRLARTLEKYEVESVIHTAGMSHPDLSIELPLTTVTANVEGTVSLLEAMRLAGRKRLVNLSSETVYGHRDGVITERAPTCPTTPYGVTKVATELFGKVYNELYGLQVVSLRVSEIYGPGNKMPQITRDIIKTVLNGTSFTMPTGADHTFQLIHIEDAARACLCAASARDPSGWVYNIAGAERCTLAEMIDLIKARLPAADIQVGPGHWHLDRQGPWSIEAARTDLGYLPSRSLEEGITDYIGWLEQHAA